MRIGKRGLADETFEVPFEVTVGVERVAVAGEGFSKGDGLVSEERPTA